MSLLRNFSPGGSEPDDNEQPTTAAQQDEEERPATAQPEESAPSGGGHSPGAARYAFAGPADPVPGTVVPAEVVPGPDLVDEPAPPPVAAAADREATPADPEPPVGQDAPGPVFEAAATGTPAPETVPVPVPSPRAAGEFEPAAQPAVAPEQDVGAPLLGHAAELRARWQRVQGDFVDDPRAAVSGAADLVGQTVETLMEALRQRQQLLRAAWERGSAAAADGQPAATMDTEQLRLMMQRYRALFNELCRPS